MDPWGLKECTTLCWLSKADTSGVSYGTTWNHNTSNGPPNSISFDNCQCPSEYPILEKTWLVSAGREPISPTHSFPAGWEHLPYTNPETNNTNRFAVPSTTQLVDPYSVNLVRMCGKCCKEDTCSEN